MCSIPERTAVKRRERSWFSRFVRVHEPELLDDPARQYKRIHVAHADLPADAVHGEYERKPCLGDSLEVVDNVGIEKGKSSCSLHDEVAERQ
jgi:hypothetical protein